MLEKLKLLLSRLNYSHFWNLQKFSKINDDSQDIIKIVYDTRNKVVSDFRNAHMNIVAGTIAFLGFMWKDQIVSTETYWYFKYFIFGSILYLVVGYYIDNFFLWNELKIRSSNLMQTTQARNKIEKIKFDESEIINLRNNIQHINPLWRSIWNYIIWLLWVFLWGLFCLWVWNLL